MGLAAVTKTERHALQQVKRDLEEQLVELFTARRLCNQAIKDMRGLLKDCVEALGEDPADLPVFVSSSTGIVH